MQISNIQYFIWWGPGGVRWASGLETSVLSREPFPLAHPLLPKHWEARADCFCLLS